MISSLALMSVMIAPDFGKLGEETLAMIQRHYYLPDRKLYSEKADRKEPAYNWGVGVMLSALNAAAQYDAKYMPQLREFADATRLYWNDGGYDVLPGPKSKDRYYDDNAWMALAFVETHRVLGDKKYLAWAQDALNFALQGEAKDGGIYWRETDRASRNTCSCAPTAAACLAIYAVTKEESLKQKAQSLFNWTETNLKDPSDHLLWDALGNDGRIHKDKWSYNTALMIRAAQDLRLPSAKILASAAHQRWFKDGKLNDPGRFAHLLIEALLLTGGHRSDIALALIAVHAARSKEGFLPSHWHNLKTEANPELLDQAAFARSSFVLALTPRAK